MLDNKVALKHIYDAISSIEKYIANVDFDSFLANEEKQDAIIRKLEIVGEAASKLTSDFREANTHIPWRDVIDMRNRLIHVYFSVDLEIVWDVVQTELPQLKSQIIPFL